jgi:hypothetical protein
VLWRALGGGEARVCASVEEALAAARAFAAAGAGLGDTHALVTGSLTSWARRSPRAGAGADDDGGDEGRV